MENVILIGMPGAGKSTVGVVLAKALGLDFVDSDLVICRRTGQPLQRTLDEAGLEAFLDLEEDVVLSLALDHAVLATGGSVPLREKAMASLKAQGTVIYLQVPLAELERRLSNITTRGIAFAPGEGLAELYAKRTPIYERWADVTVCAPPDRDDLEAMVEAIAAALQAR